ncbi:MAG: hypothetical protein ACLSAF_17040 [Intestinimonas sp.]
MKLVQRSDPTFTLSSISDDDPKVFQMLSEGKTSGVFQMESPGMTGVCVGLKPQNIEDITAIAIALYRPGPMDSIPRFIACKHDPKLIRYKHPALIPILSVTYGCIVYQEQVIEIFRKLGGYSLGQADMVRRAISKKKKAQIEKERHSFIHGDPERGIPGCVANGIPAQTGEDIYDEIYDFANYAFNKAHAVSYAIVCYQTAWFECHHMREKKWRCFHLRCWIIEEGGRVHWRSAVRAASASACRRTSTSSNADFAVDNGSIRFGLVAVKARAGASSKTCWRSGAESGRFTSFPDFCQRMMGADLNRRVVESLIKCGAFDSLGYTRSQLMEVYGQVLDDGIAQQRRKNLEGQFDLFGGGERTSPPAFPELVLPNPPGVFPQPGPDDHGAGDHRARIWTWPPHG